MKRETGKRRRSRRVAPRGIAQPAHQPAQSPFPPLGVFSEEQIDEIHTCSMRILSEHGVEVGSARAHTLLASASAEENPETESGRVPSELVTELIASSPSSVTLTPPAPACSVTIGGRGICFGLVAAPPHTSDTERGRRPATIEDYEAFVKFAHSFNIVHLIGNQVVPAMELSAETHHLDTYSANLTLSRLVFHVTAIGATRARDGFGMMAIALGMPVSKIVESPGLITVIPITRHANWTTSWRTA